MKELSYYERNKERIKEQYQKKKESLTLEDIERIRTKRMLYARKYRLRNPEANKEACRRYKEKKNESNSLQEDKP